MNASNYPNLKSLVSICTLTDLFIPGANGPYSVIIKISLFLIGDLILIH